MEAISMGDVLREIDGRSLVKSDFILVSGDVIANIKLDQILQEHKWVLVEIGRIESDYSRNDCLFTQRYKLMYQHKYISSDPGCVHFI